MKESVNIINKIDNTSNLFQTNNLNRRIDCQTITYSFFELNERI